MKKLVKRVINKTERGQAVILLALAIVGLVAMVGLVTDTGILLIQYGKLKRGVDAAAIAAAQQYRIEGTASTLDPVELENTAKNFLQLNEAEGVTSIEVHSCEDAVGVEGRPSLCNPLDPSHPDYDSDANRKLVSVIASADVNFGFLSVVGIKSTTISASAVGEAATLDVVLIIDTSASMAFETDVSPFAGDADPAGADNNDHPGVCNYATDSAEQCQPMKAVKDVALSFIETLYFPYDRVAVITMTSITEGTSDWETAKAPLEIIPLTSDKDLVQNAIGSIQVFEPRDCTYGTNAEGEVVLTGTDIPGNCLPPPGGTIDCPIWALNGYDIVNPGHCLSSNVGGTLKLAKIALTGSNGAVTEKLDAFWVVVAVLAGPANATDIPRLSDGTIDPDHEYGYCPAYTWPAGNTRCRDTDPWARHQLNTDPENYDADDYARDQADSLANLTTGDGVTIYTIGLGNAVSNVNSVGARLFEYIAECAGEDDPDDCYTPVAIPVINHGQYFYSPNAAGLSAIFQSIANNIATKISQ